MRIFILVIVFLTLFTGTAFSDMGAIVPDETVDLTEPAQRAIIAHDGFSEILILSTDFDTSSDTKVVRFIPFPSKALIKEGSKETFKNLETLVKKYNLHYLTFYRSGEPKKEGIEVISDQTLGPHKIVQVKVNDFSDFVKWVKELFKKEGISKEGFTEKEQDIIVHYLKMGINYFVFDIVDLSTGINSITPLVYKFDTPYFYYPLVTSSAFPGTGSIELFIFSNYGETLQKVALTPMPYPWKRSETAIVNWEDMEMIEPDIARLMGEHAIMGAVKYKGTYDVNFDIWFKIPIYQLKPYNPLQNMKKR